MERNIGEEFSFNGYRLKVEKATNADCNGCFFFEQGERVTDDAAFSKRA